MGRLTHLLDTNILSDLVRHPAGKITQRIRDLGEERICTSLVVAAELSYGAYKKGSMRLTSQLEVILSGLDVLPLEQPTDDRYAELRTTLEQAGTPIGPNTHDAKKIKCKLKELVPEYTMSDDECVL